MELYILVGLFAAICIASSFIPQVRKIIKTKNVEDLSFKMYLILLIGASSWFLYGFLISNWVIIFANALTLFLIILIIFMILKYKKKLP